MQMGLEFPDLNGLSHGLSKERKKFAGEGWVRDFCKRHGLAVRTPEQCSMGRIVGLTL